MGPSLSYVERHFVKGAHPKGDLIYCITTDTEIAMSFATKELKISSYLPFPCEFYFNGHNAIKQCLEEEDEPDRFTKSVLVGNGKKVPAIDCRKSRQVELLKELINPKCYSYGFKMADLLSVLSDSFGNSAQIRYELQKLLARDLVKKQKNKSFYRVTEQGWKWMWVTITSAAYFANPLI